MSAYGCLSWGLRLGLPLDLAKYANIILKPSDLFNGLGSADGSMYVIIKAKGLRGDSQERRWFIIARNGDDLQILTVLAILLAEKLITKQLTYRGATACIGLVTFQDYLATLKDFAITTETSTSN